MEKEQKVSVWFGVFENEKSFTDFMEVDYTEDGDGILSKFELHFGITWYDEDFIEVGYLKQKQCNFCELLKDFSYSDTILSNINQKHSDMYYNTVVLLYHFEYDGKVKQYKDSNNNQLNYIACVDYM